MSKDPIPDLAPALVEAVLAFARERGVRSAHYVGNADRGLIEGLTGIVGKEALSIMDYPDRWQTSFAFWWDEREFPGIPCPERPEWLEGISCYEEGGPACPDLWIHDIAWSPSRQLARILAFTNRKHGLIPNLALLGPARQTTRLKSYQWRDLGDVLLASLPDPSTAL
jgi:hypothetical protein